MTTPAAYLSLHVPTTVVTRQLHRPKGPFPIK